MVTGFKHSACLSIASFYPSSSNLRIYLSLQMPSQSGRQEIQDEIPKYVSCTRSEKQILHLSHANVPDQKTDLRFFNSLHGWLHSLSNPSQHNVLSILFVFSDSDKTNEQEIPQYLGDHQWNNTTNSVLPLLAVYWVCGLSRYSLHDWLGIRCSHSKQPDHRLRSFSLEALRLSQEIIEKDLQKGKEALEENER